MSKTSIHEYIYIYIYFSIVMMAANDNSYVVQMVLGVAHYQIYNRRRYMNLETDRKSVV